MLLLIIFWLNTLPFHWQQQTSQSIPAYPAWFWEIPIDNTTIFAVGYAPRYARIDTSYAYARRNSIWQLVRSQQVAIDASQELHNQFGQHRLIGLKEVESIDSTLALAIQGNFNIVDSAVVGDMVLSLALLSGDTNFLIFKERIPPSKRPQWIDTIPQDKSIIYAVGTAPQVWTF